MGDGPSSTTQQKGTKWALVSFVLLVCLIEIQYAMIDYRLEANLQVLRSTLHEIRQLDSGPLPNTATDLRKSGDGSLNEESLIAVASKHSSLRRPTSHSTQCTGLPANRHGRCHELTPRIRPLLQKLTKVVYLAQGHLWYGNSGVPPFSLFGFSR
jgi:hypothetical protein